MKTISKIILASFALVLLFTSCQKKASDVPFMKEDDNFSVDCMAQRKNINFFAPAAWTLSVDSDWIKPDRTSGPAAETHYSYTQVTFAISYNKGEQRVGNITINCGGKSANIAITQEKCGFAYFDPELLGGFTTGKESTATVQIPYVKASGEEVVVVSGTVEGAAAAGLSIKEDKYSLSVAEITEENPKGILYLSIPVVGTPTVSGDITIKLSIDGKAQAPVSAKVAPSGVTVGFPVFWNFNFYNGTASTAGTNATEAANYIKDANYCFWSTANTYNAEKNWKGYYKDWSNKGAILTIQIAGTPTYGYGQGHCYSKGMVLNDAFVYIVPVENLVGGQTIVYSSGTAASGSGPAFYAVEYSQDGTNWILAEGSHKETAFDGSTTGDVHIVVPNWDESVAVQYNEMLSNEDDGNSGFYTIRFKLDPSINIASGNFYLRQRISVDMRRSRATSSIAATGSERLKGKITIALDE
ncbi:MAG: BACON domain-containing protein [Bacteroidales bacterium]|nr:BACON domain-containing protein [Bacteroidales bacterium]